jgi:transposase
VPAKAIHDLRDYTRARIRLVQERTRCWQRLEKLLEGALVKVSAVASSLTTLSAQDMIKAMIAGQRDPRALADLARGRMRAKREDLVEALDGMFDDHHGELAGMPLDQIAFLDARIAQLTSRAAELATAMPAAWGVNADGTTGPDAGTGPDAPVLNAVARLAEIPGVSQDLARAIIAETAWI